MAGSPGERLRWADLVKGTCIVLVVLWHVHILHYMELDWAVDLPVRRAWIELHSALIPVRMPVFFAISGMFAASALQRTWREVAVRRLALPYYLYVLWLVIHAGIYTALQTEFSALRVASLSELALNLIVPVNSLWYVYALALYFLVAKALSRVPAWGVFAGAALLSAAVTDGWFTAPGLLGSVARNFVFFLAGAYLPSVIKVLAARARGPQLAISGAAYAAVVAVYLLGLHRAFGLDVLAGLVAISFGVTAASLVVRSERMTAVGSHLGRNTLPIYLMHAPLIALVDWLSRGPGAPAWARILDNDFIAGAYPLLVGVGVVGASLLAHRLLIRCRAGWLFALPPLPRRGRGAASPVGTEQHPRLPIASRSSLRTGANDSVAGASDGRRGRSTSRS